MKLTPPEGVTEVGFTDAKKRSVELSHSRTSTT